MPPNLRNLARVNRKSPLELAALNEVATQRVSEFCGIETSTCRLLHMQARPEPQTQSLAHTHISRPDSSLDQYTRRHASPPG